MDPNNILNWSVIKNDPTLHTKLLGLMCELENEKINYLCHLEKKLFRMRDKFSSPESKLILNNLIISVRTEKKNSPEYKNISILSYQKYSINESLKYVKNFKNAIDAGSNYGVVTYHLSKSFEKVYSFEIHPLIRECLKQNVSNFNLNNVEIFDCGLGNVESTVDLVFKPKNTFSTHINPNQKSGSVPVKTIDSFNFKDISFIKIDCEGYEPYVIEGAKETITNYSPVILLECHKLIRRYKYEFEYPVKLLKKWGYSLKKQMSNDYLLVKE